MNKKPKIIISPKFKSIFSNDNKVIINFPYPNTEKKQNIKYIGKLIASII